MGLRDIKRTGGFLQQVIPEGTWVTYGPGELAKCPAPHCGTGAIQPSVFSQVRIRVAMEGVGESEEPSGFTLCRDSRCKARLEIKIDPAPKGTRSS